MKSKLSSVLSIALCSALMLSACAKKSEGDTKKTTDFPTNEINFVIPFDAGGSSDMMVRAMEKLSYKYFGQNMVITNTPGGGGTIGWNELVGKKADGYTVGSANTSMLLQPLYGQTKHDYMEALEPISLIATIPIVIAVRSDSPFKTIEDLIAHAKANPKKLKYSHAGLGSITHVTAELFAQKAGIQMEQVPFSGGAKALTALLGGHVDAISGNKGEFKSQIVEGKMRALAVTQDKRVKDEVFKDAPTLKEKGFDVNLQVWQGVGAPKDLPAEVRKVLEEGFKKIVEDPEFIEAANKIGLDIHYLNAEQFGKMWKDQRAVFQQVVESSGILDLIKAQKK